MKICNETGYALLAVGYVARHKDKPTIPSHSIAREYDMPLEYLLRILQRLVKANILRSKRGPRGGYSLARPPKQITMLQIIEAVEGPIVNQFSLKEQAPKERFSANAERVYERALAKGKDVFQKVKFSELLGD